MMQVPPVDPTPTSAVSRPANDRPVVVGFAHLEATAYRGGPAAGHCIPQGLALPGFVGRLAEQPIQGFSGAFYERDGTLTVVSDNGFGQKRNSPDYELCLYNLTVEPRTKTGGSGAVTVNHVIKLTDPKGLAGQPIVAELEFYPTHDGSGDGPKIPVAAEIRRTRTLTGADFDPESIRRAADGTLWVGDEFGPFLLHFSARGELLERPISIPVPESLRAFARGQLHFVSPDHPTLQGLETDTARIEQANCKRSKGIEGLALSSDGEKLFLLMEGPLIDDVNQRRLLLCEYVIKEGKFSGRYWFYELERAVVPSASFLPHNTKIGCCTALTDDRLAVIETDDAQGSVSWCKRVYEIDLATVPSRGTVAKKLLIDLLDLENPDRLTAPIDGEWRGEGQTLRLDHFCLESVVVGNPGELLLVNDNNFPTIHGSARVPGKPDHNEFCFIKLPKVW